MFNKFKTIKFKPQALYSIFNIPNSRGQSLVGLLLTIAVGAIVLILGAQIIQASLKVEEATRQRMVAFQLARESFEAAKAIAGEDWHLLYDAVIGQEYYLDNSLGYWALSTDTQYKTITLGQDAYTRWLIFSNVSRDDNGDIESSYDADHDDPSTKKTTVYVKHGSIQKIVWSYYLTRWENEISNQTDWTGDAGEEGPVTSFGEDYYSGFNILTENGIEVVRGGEEPAAGDLGDSCVINEECVSGYCVDGVCCNTVCTGSTCQTCGTYSSEGIGYCGYVNSSGQDPDSECSQGSTSSDGCEADNCTGTGYSCAVQSSGDGGCPVCGKCSDSDIACEYHSNGTYDTGCSACHICSGAEIGSCASNSAGTECGAGTYGCIGTYYKCASGICMQTGCVKSIGESCSVDGECTSGYCADGVCCNTACNSTCQACTTAKKGSGEDGTCGYIADNTDPDSECAYGNGNCDGLGFCDPKNLGESCSVDGECVSGYCTDGVCCNTACNSTCQACTTAKKGSGEDGTCGYIADNTDPDSECTTSYCDNDGNCNGSGACDYFANGYYLIDSDLSVNCSNNGANFTMWPRPQTCDGTNSNSKALSWGGEGVDEPTNSCINIADRPACNYCDNLSWKGYSDWYLPASTQLQDLWTNRVSYGISYTSDFYWSSTEASVDNSWLTRFTDGFSSVTAKNTADYFYLRCVRAQ